MLLLFYVQFFYILVFLQLAYLYGYTFSKGKDHIHTLNTMTVKYPCIVCNRAVAKNHKAVGCDHCGRWVHIACNYLNVYTYRKLQKDKSPWYCLCCIKKKYHFVLLKMSNEKTITNAIRQNKINHEELLRKAKNQFFTPN